MIVVLAMMLIACTSSQHRAGLDSADSLMNARPDSALTLLNALLPDTTRMSKGDLMRFHLLRTNAENKCDTVLTARHAALMRRVCDYYDRKSPSPFGEGSGVRLSNSRMLAHYLLGRCYSDMGEAPAALQEFHNAADAADTTRTDCDYYTLSRVHGYIADVFSRHQMLNSVMQEVEKASRYARYAKDTLASIYYDSNLSRVYYQLGDMDSYLNLSEKEAERYLLIGRKDLASMSYAATAFLLIERGDLRKAEKRISMFEKMSGLFDAEGSIMKGHENYYYIKGLLYYHKNNVDSAYICYRKAFEQGDFNSRIAASQELCRLFTSLHDNDSVAKYAQLSYQLNDSAYSQNTANILQEMQATYDYSRMEKLARQKELQLNTRTWQLRLGLVIGAVLILSFVAVFVYVNRRHKKKMFENRVEMNEQYAIYREEKSRLEEEKEALQGLLQEKNDEFQNEQQHLYLKMEEKNESINKLNLRILEFEKAHAQVKANYEADGKMASTGIFNLFREYTIKAKNKPKEEDWQRLIKMVERTLPNFKPIVAVRAGIEGDEYRVCVLSRLGFKPGDICSLMEKDYAYVTKTRKRLLKKIFKSNGTAKDFDTLIMGVS